MTAPRPSASEIFLTALRLGATSFGGPVAHLAFFRREYVARRRWVEEAEFAEVVALCQFLPGPTSSQVGFALGCRWRGLAGGVAAWVGFTLPSAVVMIGAGLGVGMLQGQGAAFGGALAGLKLAAVAVVAQAVVAMGRQLCPDGARRLVALAGAGLVWWWPSAWGQVAVLVAGALVGWGLPGRVAGAAVATDPPVAARPGRWAWVVVAAVVGCVGLGWLARASGSVWWGAAENYARAGALVFGGGHVVLPWLEQAVVGPGGLTADQFLAGYGAAQALPGPLFAFAGYLGAADPAGPGGWLGGAWAIAWIFAPGLLLVLGVLPGWARVRGRAGVQAAMRGANAAVVGLLLAAWVDPVVRTAVKDAGGAALALAALAALHVPRVPPWLVVAGCALAGAALARTGL